MELSRIRGLRPWQQEKHYIQAMILVALSESPVAFKGGTYLWFYHGLSRFSEDLDFTQIGKLKSGLPDSVSRTLSLYGVENELKIMKDDDFVLSFRIMARGPLNTGMKDRCVVYVEISRREKLILETIPLKIDFPEYQLPVKRISGMSLLEVASEKVRAIMTRNKSRDIYDLYYMITRKGVPFDRDMIDAKLAFYGKGLDKDEFMNAVLSREERFKRELRGIILDDMPDYGKITKKFEDWIEA